MASTFQDAKEKFAAGNGVLRVTHSINARGHYQAIISYQEGDAKINLKTALEGVQGFFKCTHGEKACAINSTDDHSIVLTFHQPAKPKNGLSGEYAASFGEHQHVKHAVQDLQSVLSKKEYVVQVDDQGHQDTLHVSSSILGKNVEVHINTRKYDRAPTAPGDRTMGFGNDPEKIPMALGIAGKLFPTALQSMQRREGGYPSTDTIHLKNASKHQIELVIESDASTTVANRVLADINRDLGRFEEQGIALTGGHAEQVAGKLPTAAELRELSNKIETAVTAAMGTNAGAMKLSADIFRDVKAAMGLGAAGRDANG